MNAATLLIHSWKELAALADCKNVVLMFNLRVRGNESEIHNKR
jgi:hypothetical protein